MVKNNIKNILKAFSLAEILLSVTIVAIILLLAMPAITKKSLDNIISKGSDSAEFYFSEANNDNSILPCYITELGTDNLTTNVKENTGECQVYDFTIPKGVHKIDMTLVAGGGGGGGAAGGRILIKTLTSTDTDFTFNRTRLKSAKINILTGAGTEGETVEPRKGGNSGTAVIDFTLPNNFIAVNESLNLISSDYSTSNPSTKEAVKATFNIAESAGLIDTSQTPIAVDFKGKGIKFTSKTEDNVSDYTALFFLSDAAGGSNPYTSSKVLCAKNITDPTLNLADQTAGATIVSVSGKKDLSSSDNIVSELCKLNPSSYKASVEGQTPVGLPNSTDTITSGKISMGGKGGNNGTIWYEKGKGGNGAELVYNCYKSDGSSAATNCKWTANYTSNTYSSNTEAGERYGEITFEIEHPGSGGAGGVGGSAVKISNLVVRPGKTYKIVVGKGGQGGSKGRAGVVPSTGSDGTGGSATAIYDDTNNLVLMVAGGAGGKGGRIISTTSLTSSAVPSVPTSSRSVPLVIIGSKYNGNLTLDDEIATVSAITSSDKVEIASNGIMAGATSWRLIYSFMRNMVQPMFALSTKWNYSLTQPANYNFDRYNDSSTTGDRKMGGFSDYSTGILTNSANYVKAFINGTYNYKGDNIQLPYTGFYFRYPILGSFYYAGGLGGFSGIGGKAGCGGGFVGNYSGYKMGISALTGENTVIVENKLVNTIAMLKREGANDVAKIFDVNEYFDGCTTSTTDGHTAEFIAPVISNGKIENYGSAGTGGGGGGYNINLGSGNGADGQNGYVVITWKK